MKEVTVAVDKIDRIETVDHQTGEITKEETSVTYRITHGTEPPFIKIYIEDILYISDMPKSLSNVVYSFLQYTSYANAKNGMCIALNPYIKKQICDECGFENMRSLNNSITKLVQGNILKRLGASTYQFNPYLFGRGEWKDIAHIRTEWNYNVKGRTFNSIISYKNEENEQLSMEPNNDERETDTNTVQPLNTAI